MDFPAPNARPAPVAPEKGPRVLTVAAEAAVFKLGEKAFVIEISLDGDAMPPIIVRHRGRTRPLFDRIASGMVSARNYYWGLKGDSYPAKHPQPWEVKERGPPHETDEKREERLHRNHTAMWDDGITAFCKRLPSGVECDLDPQFDFRRGSLTTSASSDASSDLERHKRVHRGLPPYETEQEIERRYKRMYGRGWRKAMQRRWG